MKYNPQDIVVLNTEVRENGRKYILTREPSEETVLGSDRFQVLGRDSKSGHYVVMVPEGYVGWTLDEPKIKRVRHAAAFKGKRFWDVPEEFIVMKVANEAQQSV